MLTRWMGLIREPSPGINALVTPLSRADVWGNWSRRLGKHSWAGTRTSAGWEKEGLGPGLPSPEEGGPGGPDPSPNTPSWTVFCFVFLFFVFFLTSAVLKFLPTIEYVVVV